MPNYGSFVPEALKESDNPAYATLGETLYLPPTIEPDDILGDLVPLLVQGDHAIMVTLDYVIFHRYNRSLSLVTYVLDEKLYMGHMSWWLPLNTPYTSTVSRHLINLLENGVLRKIYRNYVGHVIRDVQQLRENEALTLAHLQGAFILRGIGLLTGLLFLLVERLA
ncbi:hypothetical protein Pcinc_028852 [Petrolisthes cinctipes]|uniref:Uncharacterized protein n=1 Tax=Petrolisthes cinctipes TaxID=88211 RepID=A0AAE1F1H9_PETCI|nr:hypothetical protein Pcinc_028852 [Petrolisthes cinctipes]